MNWFLGAALLTITILIYNLARPVVLAFLPCKDAEVIPAFIDNVVAQVHSEVGLEIAQKLWQELFMQKRKHYAAAFEGGASAFKIQTMIVQDAKRFLGKLAHEKRSLMSERS